MVNALNAELNPICYLLALLGTHHILHVGRIRVNALNAELNPICYLLALLGAQHFLHVSRIRIKSLTLRLLMSYTYGAAGRSPAEIVGSNPTRGHGYLSVVSVVCCQVEISATS